MKIEILGTGCLKCDKLHERAHKVIEGLGVEAELVKVQSLEEIAAYGVAFTPALVIDGEVKAAGRLPKPAQIEAWIIEAQGIVL